MISKILDICISIERGTAFTRQYDGGQSLVCRAQYTIDGIIALDTLGLIVIKTSSRSGIRKNLRVWSRVDYCSSSINFRFCTEIIETGINKRKSYTYITHDNNASWWMLNINQQVSVCRARAISLVGIRE